MGIPTALKTEAALIAVGIIGVILVGRNMRGIAAGVVEGAADIIVEAGTGVVIGVGDIIGVPRTDENACQAAMREGRTWDASFACPTATFLNYVTNGWIDTKNKGLQ